MSLGACIPDMIARGEIDKARGKRMAELFRQLERHYLRAMAPDAAASAASEETLRQLTYEANEKQRQASIQIMRQKAALADLDRFKGGSKYDAIAAMVSGDVRADYGNVEQAAERTEFQTHAKLREFIERHRRDMTGKAQDAAGLDDIIDELHGTSSGNDRARMFADAVKERFDALGRSFIAAGGSLRLRADFGVPHRYDTFRVRDMGLEGFRELMLANLDPSKMTDPRTGGAFTQERLNDYIEGAFEGIRTNGIGSADGGGMGGSGKLANSRTDHRVFVFKDGPAWRTVHAAIGEGTPFDIILDHARGLAHDSAMMERLGPNPDATIKWLLDQVDTEEAKSAKARPGAIDRTSGGRHRVERLWDYVNGKYNVPVFAEGKILGPLTRGLVKGTMATRNILAAAMLGSSPISAITDLSTQGATRRLNGLPEWSMYMDYLKQLNPADGSHRELAIRLGLGMRDATRSMMTMSRYFGDVQGPWLSTVIADGALRLSGINKFTEAGQRAYGIATLGELGAHRGVGWDALPADLRDGMAKYGIDDAAWNLIRTSPTVQEGGAHFMDWQAVTDKSASDRMMDYVLGETRRAVQETSAADRAVMTVGRPGTATGELARAGLQFKSFSVALIMAQARQVQELAGRRGTAAAIQYAASFMIRCWIAGAIVLQLREIRNGKDMRPSDNPEFWADAFLQGGGLGIMGDLVGTFMSDRIGSIGEFIGGPTLSLATDVKNGWLQDVKTAAGNAVHPDRQKDTHFGRHTIRMAERYLPGANTWYIRLALQREVFDQLQREIDPTHDASWAQMERVAAKQGQGSWWQTGETAPSRMPTMNATPR